MAIYDENVGLIRADDGDFEAPAVVGVEYLSPDQKSGLHGTIYRQYFTTALPAGLTSGDNVAKLIDFALEAADATHRYTTRGWGNDGTKGLNISLSGTTGNGDLALSVTGTFAGNLIAGWVDYTK